MNTGKKMNEFFTYGEQVDGYDVRVLNEREARAGAGILFAIGLLSLTNAVMLGHVVVTRFFITFFTLDFLIRVIQPRYAPSLLLGRLFVQNQTPEYVGAAQKRFAWAIGLLLAIPMFYMLVIHFVPNPTKVLICIICLLLLISESAFSLCLGCSLYGLFSKKQVTNCPGDVCEIRTKDPVQRFDTAQKVIVSITALSLLYGIYAYTTKVEDKTFLMKKVSQMMMSDDELKALEEQRYQQALDDFDNDDDF